MIARPFLRAGRRALFRSRLSEIWADPENPPGPGAPEGAKNRGGLCAEVREAVPTPSYVTEANETFLCVCVCGGGL